MDFLIINEEKLVKFSDSENMSDAEFDQLLENESLKGNSEYPSWISDLY